MKKLKLNKETLISLQEKQMKSILGGEVLASNGSTSSYTCAPSGGVCNPVTTTCPVPTESLEAEAASCCKKTCNA